MTDEVAPEFERFVVTERQASRAPGNKKQLKEGELAPPVYVGKRRVPWFLRVAARRAVGLSHKTKHTEVVWAHGDRELAVSLADLDVKLSDGLICVLLPVRCDQTGKATVEVTFAVGKDDEPAGLYAAAYRRPNGPPLIVEAWGETLVAFAWQCILGMVNGIAGAVGRDAAGQVLVPVELTASRKGIQIVPMARYRFTGSPSTPKKAR
jgi:hypothetical protein